MLQRLLTRLRRAQKEQAGTVPNWSRLQEEPALMLSFGLGSGLSPIAPGTLGTLVGLVVFIPVMLYQPWLGWALAIAGTVFGGQICQAGIEATGVEDHSGIVWDEIVAIWWVLLFLPAQTPLWWLAAFVAFRVFDVLKPPPISLLERQLKGGWGVMMDDLLAAGYALMVLWLVQIWLLLPG